jgi:hypothetical protein
MAASRSPATTHPTTLRRACARLGRGAGQQRFDHRHRYGGTSNSATSAVSLYGALVNTGTITANGAQGVAIGSTWTTANTNPDTTLTNSGTILADGAAIVEYGAVAITNSGTITSRTTSAITAPNGYGSTLTNLAGGTISGVGTAIQMQGGLLSNAGTINGNVAFISGSGGIYVANGGTLNGNLTLAAARPFWWKPARAMA